MELLDLTQLAERADLPHSLARYYRDRFILFIPSVRVGRAVLHPVEAVQILQLIAGEAKAGASAVTIESLLERSYPVTVITSQHLGSDPTSADSTAVVKALAGFLDERGARLETELNALRDQINEIHRSPASDLISEFMARADERGEHARADLSRIKNAVDSIQTRQQDQASHEQLEWIGDVVAAAVLKPTETVSKASIERALNELKDEFRRPRPNADVAELNIAVERLSEHVHSRDEEFQRVLKNLVGAMRAEIHTLQESVNELRAPEPIEPSAMPLLLTAHRQEAIATEQCRADEATIEQPQNDLNKMRAPRRLGQTTKAQDFAAPDFGTDQTHPS
jgi:hypothetical protein